MFIKLHTIIPTLKSVSLNVHLNLTTPLLKVHSLEFKILIGLFIVLGIIIIVSLIGLICGSIKDLVPAIKSYMYRANNSNIPGRFSDGRTITSNFSNGGFYTGSLAGINNGSGSGDGRDDDNNGNNSNTNIKDNNLIHLLYLELRIYSMLLLYLYFLIIRAQDSR